MLEGLYSAAAGMQAQQQRMDSVANDLANVNTNGYKHTRVAFRDLLYVRDASGPVHLNTSNGSIRVIGWMGPTELKTSNGVIEIQRERAVVTANTSNGSISFKGSLADGKQSFKTTNGSIALTLPGDAQFRVEAGTSLGVVTSDFTPAESRRKPATHLKATVGQDPKTAIEAHTSNGSISLLKAAK